MYSRTFPFRSRIKERILLTKEASTKKTYHIVLDITGAHFPLKVGDSIAICPTNDPQEVDLILSLLDDSSEARVIDPRTHETVPLHDFLLYRANLSRANLSLLKLLIERGAPFVPLLEEENKAKLTSFLHEHTLSELLRQAPHPIIPAEFVKVAMPLLPRFYSIANSTKMFPDELHLLVAYVHYTIHGQERFGVGSHFLCDLAEVDVTAIPIYLQPSHSFTLPPDPNASLICIGPGTGVAPYRAFLQERLATQSTGRNWLFFGERNRATDFYYSDFWLDLERQERIRLDLAFSRDGPEKVYVQHKLYTQRKSVWNWIEQGAYVYVCGDAEEMAKEVDAMLHCIAHEEGHLSQEDARLYIKTLRTTKRYLCDVY